MKTYILNLDKDIDRLKFMREQFDTLGMEFTRIPGVLGANYDGDEYNDNMAINYNGKSLTKGELGCALSHKRAWEEFVNSQDDYALICEDDIIIKNKNFKNIIESIVKNNIDVDYIQIDYNPFGPTGIYYWSRELLYTIQSKKLLEEKILLSTRYFTHLPLIIIMHLFYFVVNIMNQIFGPRLINIYKKNIFLASCYIINQNAAKRLIKLQNKIIYPADKVQNVLKNKGEIKLKYLSPLMTRQNKTFNTNIGRV